MPFVYNRNAWDLVLESDSTQDVNIYILNALLARMEKIFNRNVSQLRRDSLPTLKRESIRENPHARESQLHYYIKNFQIEESLVDVREVTLTLNTLLASPAPS